MIKIYQILVSLHENWSHHHIPRLAAALAYRTIFAFVPIISISLVILSVGLGQALAEESVYGEINSILGVKAVDDIKNIVTLFMQQRSHTFATTFGFLLLIYASAGLFSELKQSIDDIFEIKRPGVSNIFIWFLQEIASLILVSISGFLLILSVLFSSLLLNRSALLLNTIPYFYYIGFILNPLVIFFVTTVIFALIFKYVPESRIKWKDVCLSAPITSLLFILGKIVFEFYLSFMNITSSYGAAGTLVGLLLWIYYSTQILFFGVLLTKLHSRL